MWPVSEAFLTGLTFAHRMRSRVDLYVNGTLTAQDIAISGGEVTVDAQSNVRRTLRCTVPDPSLLDILDPYNADLQAWRGMVHLNGVTEWVPLGKFRVWDVEYDRPGLEIGVTAQDYGALVAGEFLNPAKSARNDRISDAIIRLLKDAGPSLSVTDYTGLPDKVGVTMIHEGGRWDALNQLAAALDASVYFDPIGEGLIYPDEPGDPVWTVAAGGGGVLVESSVALTREGTYNAVVAEAEGANASTPVRAVVKDTNPQSPTYWEGEFGKFPIRVTSPAWNTTSKATRAATRLLRTYTGKVKTVDFSSVPNPALEAGDVVRVEYADGGVEDLVLDRFAVPLVGGAFTATARSKRTL